MDVEIWIQTADPKVTIDALLAFFNGSVAKIGMLSATLICTAYFRQI